MKNKKEAKILIIEDEAALLYAISAQLSSEGYEAIAATNIEEGFNKMIEKEPQLVLLDIVIAGRSSLEFIEKIKTNRKLKGTPIIIISDEAESPDIAETKTLGVSGHIIKTKHSIEEIIQIIDEMITKYLY